MGNTTLKLNALKDKAVKLGLRSEARFVSAVIEGRSRGFDNRAVVLVELDRRITNHTKWLPESSGSSRDYLRQSIHVLRRVAEAIR